MLILLIFNLLLHFTDPYDIYIAKPEQVTFYYQHNGKNIRKLANIAKIDTAVKFACNIQMYAGHNNAAYTPVGLYIENGKQIQKPWIVNNASINFGMQPQSVFATTKKNKAVIVPVNQLSIADYKYAVQLAPMLVINGKINPQLTRSTSIYVRNGVGILKDGSVLFAKSNGKVTFQQFANFFVSRGCVTASYVDGAVSETWRRGQQNYLPGEFAVMAGVK